MAGVFIPPAQVASQSGPNPQGKGAHALSMSPQQGFQGPCSVVLFTAAEVVAEKAKDESPARPGRRSLLQARRERPAGPGPVL